MKLNLPSPIDRLLAQRGGVMDPNQRGSRIELEKACAAHDYVLHPSVVDFEEEFGGLLLPDEGNVLDVDEPYWLFGAYACLTSEAHVAPRGGSKARKLVPVVYSPNDVIYFLDAKGKAYAQDTIEDTKAAPFAENGKAMMCRILLEDAVFSRGETTLEMKGLQGEALSGRLGLNMIAEASGADRKYYADATGSILVMEEVKAKLTLVACTTADQMNALNPPVSVGNAGLSAELEKDLKPYKRQEYVRMISEKRTELPDFFDHLPELRKLDVSSNKLVNLPPSLLRAKELKELDISFNPMAILPDGIGNLKELRFLSLRSLPIQSLPETLAGAKNLTKLLLNGCAELDVDAALLVIAKLPKLKELYLPLSRSLASLAPIAHLPIKSLCLDGIYVQRPDRLPAGLGQMKHLTNLEIQYADEVAGLPDAQEDVNALRLLFSKKFTDADIRKSIERQPEVQYLQAFAGRM